MEVIKQYRRGPIEIVKFHVAWDDLDPSLDELVASTTDRVTAIKDPVGLFYCNPQFLVTAPAETCLAAFVKQARRAQVLWNKHAARNMGHNSWRRRIKHEEPMRRQLLFTGILLVDGRVVHPRAWPDTPAWKGGELIGNKS